MSKSKQHTTKPINHIAARALLHYAGQLRSGVWITSAVFVVANILIAIVPWLIGRLTNSLTAHNDEVVFWTACLIVASVGHDILWRAAELCYKQLLLSRSHRFDDIVFSAIMRHPYSYFTDKFTGKVSSYANGLGREFRELLVNFHWEYLNLFVTLPIITVTMFSVNAYTGAIFVVCLMIMFIAGRQLARKAAVAERREADERSTLEGYVVDAISNFVSIKAFNSERRESQRLYSSRDALIDAAHHSSWRNFLFWGVMSTIVRGVIWPSTFILNVYLYMQGDIGLAQVTTFMAAAVLFTSFIWEVIWHISQLNIKLAGVSEAYEYLFGKQDIFATEPDAQQKQPASLSLSFRDSMSLQGLSFAYPDKPDSPILHDINLTIKRGEKVGIVGPSGGGKSTLMKLLLGYYPIASQQLLIDGQPTSNHRLTELVAYVPQDTAMFHRSIRDNIAYSRPDASQAEVITAAKHAQADEFVGQLQHGYDTLVGERGVKLSGGQRQRIAIARAILKDAPILMLDEATSALDSESEKAIQKALDDLLKDRTALVIAHRLSTIQKLDRIIVFDGGKIVESGSHAELVERQGLYAALWAHQTNGFLE